MAFFGGMPNADNLRNAEMAVLAPQYAHGQKATLFCTLGHFCEAEQKSRFHLEVKSKTPANKKPFSDKQKNG